MREYEYHAPLSLERLFELAEAEGMEVRFLAGGTDLMPRISAERNQIPRDRKPPMRIIYLGGLGLDEVTDDGESVTIGATASLSALLDNGAVRTKLPALHEALREMAGVSVRNTATIGGNIMNASPAADSVPPLLVLGAECLLRSAAGERRVALSEFFTGPGKTVARPGELLVSVTVKPGRGGSAFRKLGRRKAETLSVVNAAACVELRDGLCESVRIAVGSAAPVVVRCTGAEQALVGKKIDENSVREAGALVVKALSPIDDIRSSAWYRARVAPTMVARALLAAAERKRG
ncbi:MAG: xanthine dehydrogenase family protein subunit M [Synergistaceae bacterium]|jgi:CO/xanthine dehydrogenase FAD-binding subunit|nr:xanthine dehydrogenase family protein subunit M [Synergistaceae bacterium]